MRVIPLCVMFGGWLSMPALAADAEAWMNRFVAAEDSQSYAGTFIYERNGSFSTHTVWQAAEGEHTRQRLLQLDGPPSEVLLVDGDIRCASAQLAAQMPSGQAWSDKALDVAALSQWYDFHLIGDSRVAGRPAEALVVRPKDQHRYGFELHLDHESALPLKSLLLGESGQLLERLQYTQFSLGSVDPQQLQPGPSCEPVKAIDEQSGERVVAWHSDWLPPGFRLLDSNVRSSPASGEPVSWLSYGDGLARLSVFLEPLHGAAVADARNQMGPTVAVSKRLTTTDGDVMVTVVGEVPLGTAERIALSMRAGADQEGK
ncbi:MucB/RseB C-terminal domain-containing protein [Stutzerimonas nitrititolerans]|uniref:MucB/RseB C-terminal domain-containing protein n=1 Tax=Stutzerimonas nitrititolerans TaxID=2482751 RepID=UPI0028AE3ABD|nr:MucB/RseB C-terminal domain-containing protein [Stutzerimonas nitrititolerans]